jgi:hypothetical protein
MLITTTHKIRAVLAVAAATIVATVGLCYDQAHAAPGCTASGLFLRPGTRGSCSPTPPVATTARRAGLARALYFGASSTCPRSASPTGPCSPQARRQPTAVGRQRAADP